MDVVVIGVVVTVLALLVICVILIVYCKCCRSSMQSLSEPSYNKQRESLSLLPLQNLEQGQGIPGSRGKYPQRCGNFIYSDEHLQESRVHFPASERDRQVLDDLNAILSDMGYTFNTDGKLVDMTGRGFVFKDQQHYDQLGLVVNEYIYRILETELERKRLPAPPGLHRGFYFASSDVTSNRNGLLVLIHGTGAVRAGQWSRRLIINHSLDSGSQLPYIKRAKANGWSVVVMNTNQKHEYSECEGWIEGCNPEDHGCAVWEAMVKHSPAKLIGIVAHSYGGRVTSALLSSYTRDFKKRVAAIALTDSSCFVSSADQHYFREVARNWATSSLPLDKRVGHGYNCEQFSAGTSVHEETSWKSIGPVFAFIEGQFNFRGGTLHTVEGSSEPVSVGNQNQESGHDVNRTADFTPVSLPMPLVESPLPSHTSQKSCSV